MGSLEAAIKTGFICRLCSDMHKMVIHIYGDAGRERDLAAKINDCLPVNICPTDALPKTICMNCISQLECTYKLVRQISKVRERMNELRRNNTDTEVTNPAEICLHLHGDTASSDSDDSLNDTEADFDL